MKLIELVKDILAQGDAQGDSNEQKAAAVIQILHKQIWHSIHTGADCVIEPPLIRKKVMPMPEVRNTVEVNYRGSMFQCSACQSPYFQPGAAEDKLEHARNAHCRHSGTIIGNPNFNIMAYVMEETD